MPRTDNQKSVTAYLSLEAYDRLASFKQAEGLRSDSQAIAQIIERFFASPTPQELPNQDDENDVNNRLKGLEKKVDFMQVDWRSERDNILEIIDYLLKRAKESDVPSTVETDVPSDVPSTVESDVPSDVPSTGESDVPSTVETDVPSDVPSTVESDVPSDVPSTGESDVPSTLESDVPSDVPSTGESDVPSDVPSTGESDVLSTGESDVLSTGESDVLSDVPSTGESDVLSIGESDVLSIGESDVLSTGESDVLSDVPSTGESKDDKFIVCLYNINDAHNPSYWQDHRHGFSNDLEKAKIYQFEKMAQRQVERLKQDSKYKPKTDERINYKDYRGLKAMRAKLQVTTAKP